MIKRGLQILAVLTMVFAIIVPLTSAKPGSAPGTVGKFNVLFAGRYTGTGTLHVNGAGKLVNFKGTIRDEKTGATGSFDAATPPIALDNGRFSGTGTALGVTVQLCGRVEPTASLDGKARPKARVYCTFSLPTGEGTRVFGTN